jgi:hypothetical protein
MGLIFEALNSIETPGYYAIVGGTPLNTIGNLIYFSFFKSKRRN